MNDRLAESGRRKIAWAKAHMPLHARIGERFRSERPLADHRVGMALHLEAKTANLALALRDGGASMYVIGSNPLATQDDVVAALEREERVEVNAWHGIPHEEHLEHIDTLLDREPTLVVEDGGEVAARIASRAAGAPDSLVGITEETTTGVEELGRLEAEGRLPLPAIAVNSARMKHLIDNRYGTGQSTWDAIMRSTNLLVAGKTVVIVGYGWCGKGLAIRARGLGARVVVCELDEIKSVEALMEGFAVSSLERALPRADIVITATGQAGVIDGEKLRIVKGGAVLANAGHFGFEIDKAALESMAASHEEARDGVHAYTMPDGRVLYLVGGGELANLSVGDGHPVEIMDISFALQALSLEYLAKRHRELDPRVHPVPDAVERDVAKLVLAAMA